MRIIEMISDLNMFPRGCVLTIGNFDGVHIGHQEILATARQIAVQKQTELAAMSFEPHPVAVLHPEKAPGVLTPFTLKRYLLAEFGVDCLFVLESGQELLSLSPADFVDQFLIKDIQPSVVVEGHDFNFGAERAGNVDTLQQLGAAKGFEVFVVEPKEVRLSTGRSVRVSSTSIRYMLEGGQVGDAAVLLGRAYRLVGEIVPGRGKGKKLGFPTLNLGPVRQIIPAEGVYAGFVEIGDSEEEVCRAKEKIPAVFSIGKTQTFGSDHPQLIEAHLLIEDVGDLVGKWMAMDFVERIRSQEKFGTEKELSAQIAKDCLNIRKILADARG
jgi:riboflavin kinase/FMN adenylyltransferase